MEDFKKGDVLTKEGSMDNDIFVLKNGKLGIYKGNLQVAKFDKQGTVVGEMGTILDHPRTATIKALSDVTVERINFNLDELISNRPELTKDIIMALSKRLMDTTEVYWQLAEITPIDNELY